MTDGQLGLNEAQRAGLRQAKLTALIRSRWNVADVATLSGIGAPGPALVEVGTRPPTAVTRGWVLVDPTTPGGLGGAVAWGLRHELGELHLVVDDGAVPGPGDPSAGVLARRAGQFRTPPQVWSVEGRVVQEVAAAPVGDPAQVQEPIHGDVADLLRAHGIDPLVEHGVLIGEVLGLEVARMAMGEDGPYLAIGVGHHDREARAEMRPGQSPGAGLDEVVALVRHWRSPRAERHPANTLARERWLRSLVMGRPDVVGARWLDPVPSLLPRGDLRRAAPAAAAGEGVDGRRVVAVCSTGVDLDLVPVAADHRLAARSGALPRLAVVVPQGDDVRATRDLIGALAEPAELYTVPRDWPVVLSG